MRGFPISLVVALAVAASPSSAAESKFEDGDLVGFEAIVVPPVDRSDIGRLVDAGRVVTDGYASVVLSFGGEMREIPKTAGKAVGAVLLPDRDWFHRTLDDRGVFAFPIEIATTIDPKAAEESLLFLAEQAEAEVAFSRYRVYLYNDTDKAAQVFLYVYRRR